MDHSRTRPNRFQPYESQDSRSQSSIGPGNYRHRRFAAQNSGLSSRSVPPQSARSKPLHPCVSSHSAHSQNSQFALLDAPSNLTHETGDEEAEEPDAPRARLPVLRRMAYWHNKAGLVTTPNLNPLPKNVLEEVSSSNFTLPCLLRDDNLYQAFYPKRSIHRDPFFACLDVPLSDSIESVFHEKLGVRYTLNAPTRDAWILLERNLIAVSRRLREYHILREELPPIEEPHLPSDYGYRATHSDWDKALKCAKRSQNAFTMLSALVSFTLALWLREYADDCLDGAFDALSGHGPDPLPRSWLSLLQSSIVCQFTRGLRAGGFLNAWECRWTKMVYRLNRASVPIWLIWGKLDSTPTSLSDLMMGKLYFPPQEVIDDAKTREIVFQDIELPTPSSYMPPLTEPTPSVPTGAPSRFSSAPAPLTSVEQEDSYTGSDPLEVFAVLVPQTKPERKALAHSGQRDGEDWGAFRERMEQELEYQEKNGTIRQRKEREMRLAQVKQHGYVKKSKFFTWVEDVWNEGWYQRKIVVASDVEDEWTDHTENQRFFWPHLNEWDLVEHLPKRPPSEYQPMYEDLDDEEIAEDRAVQTEDRAMQTEDRAVGQAMLAHVEALVVHDVKQVQEEEPKLVIWPLGQYLRKRHGFDPRVKSLNTALHKGDTLTYDNVERASGRLLWPGATPDLPDLPPGEVDFDLESVVNFHNVATSQYNAEDLTYKDLPSVWDVSRTTDPSVPRLCCDPERFCLEVSTAVDGHSRFYVLRPPEVSSDVSPWFIGINSAATVLLIYRTLWGTMHQIGLGLLKQGIPFRTVKPRRRHTTAMLPEESRSSGLGHRGRNFSPNRDDYNVYLKKREQILCSSYGRAIRLRGGIAGRIARDFVSEEDVLGGPIYGDEVVAYNDDVEFVDDGVTKDKLDVVCGVFYVDSRNGHRAHSSWYPKEYTWIRGNLAGDQWSPAAEEFFVRQREKLKTDLKLHVSKTWKQNMRWTGHKSRDIVVFSERVATKFLLESSRAPRSS